MSTNIHEHNTSIRQTHKTTHKKFSVYFYSLGTHLSLHECITHRTTEVPSMCVSVCKELTDQRITLPLRGRTSLHSRPPPLS